MATDEVAAAQDALSKLEISKDNDSKQAEKPKRKDYSNDYEYGKLDKDTLLLVKQLQKLRQN